MFSVVNFFSANILSVDIVSSNKVIICYSNGIAEVRDFSLILTSLNLVNSPGN